MPLTYHAGQIEVQTEANSRPAADLLAERLGTRGPRTISFYETADLLVLATADADGRLRFVSLSGGEQPLLAPQEDGTLALPAGVSPLADGARAGAIAINLQEQRRARANGRVVVKGGRVFLDAAEELINCRKYIAPSVALDAKLHEGPQAREAVDPDDSRLRSVLGHVETAFLASLSPAGQPDVSHKGGPPGFLSFDAATRLLSWPELIGNGMLKSAGNVRATGVVSVVALDLESGDAYELSGRGEYSTELRYEEPRERALWPSEIDFPTQGRMTVRVDEVTLLRRLISPRRKVASAEKVTSCSPAEDQIPR
jgi:predicted pyridoxine 5'-phosphate oxidase superfamily flavin-nucleotide-binding protein